MYAKVIVDIVHSEVDRVFEYLVPDGLSLEVVFACAYLLAAATRCVKAM
jgi:hypothetical protein